MKIGLTAICALAAAGACRAQGDAVPHPLPVAPFTPEFATPASVASTPVQRWEVMASDITLARTFERWALAAGHKLKWDASRNFLIGAPDVYEGSFEGAIEHVLRSPGIRYSDFPLEACLYANTPPLVRVTRQGEQSRECVAAAAP